MWVARINEMANSKTGDVTPIQGKTYYGKDATTRGDAWKQEAVSKHIAMKKESS